ncbi:MAG: hypothetical protein KAH23_03555, partial [Kiritimatiellae bacterium]|nr:hypothetical protein [Kiritimatiellia bacterium]
IKGKPSIELPAKFKGGAFHGPFTAYPIERTGKTPLDKLTIADLMKNSMGIGPCESILKTTSAGAQDKGIFTCSLEAIFPLFVDAGLAKQEREYLYDMCDAVVVFVSAISDRINVYVSFHKDMLKYLAEQKQANVEHAEFFTRIEALLKPIGTKKSNNASSVAKMAKQLRPVIDADIITINYHAIAKRIAGVGLKGDNHVARCRLAVKNVRRQATIEMAKNPKLLEIGKEIRKRTHDVLGNPLGHEMM